MKTRRRDDGNVNMGRDGFQDRKDLETVSRIGKTS
jgi:hypothetical protein